MAKTKEQKEEIVAKLKNSLGKMQSVIFANFDNLSVKESNSLRKECRDKEVEVIVAKKTLLKMALKNTKLDELSDYNFNGGVASFFSYADEVAGAGIINKFSKSNQGLKMLGGIVDSQYYDESKVLALSTIPSREVLLIKMVSSLNSPISNFVGALSGNARNLVGVLTAIKNKG